MTIKMVDLTRQRQALEPGMSSAMARVLDHGGFVNGPEVKDLEARLAAYLGMPHAIACANGTDALQLLMRAADIGPGDAVFVPSLTFVATSEAVALVGAVPVFCDVVLATGTICPQSLARAVAHVKAQGALVPRAVIAVDLFSIPADYRALQHVCSTEGLLLFTDGAHSLGSGTAQGPCCALGDGAATSFYPSKALGCYGDGGAVFFRDPEMANRARSFANHGTEGSATNHVRIGTNSRLDTLQAAVLLEKLQVYDEEVHKRQVIGARYNAAFGAHCNVPSWHDGDSPCWSYYAIRTAGRDALQARIAEQGVPSVAYYKVASHVQPGYAHFPQAPGGLPNTDIFAETLLCLPMHPYLTEAEQMKVIDAVSGYFTARAAAE